MTISKLEVGAVPLGVGGDSLRSAAAKINSNFNDSSNAASRLVGTEVNQVATYGFNGIDGTGVGGLSTKNMSWSDTQLPTGVYKNTQGIGPIDGVEGLDPQSVSYTHLTLPTICSV